MLEASNLTDNTFLRQYEVKIGLSLNNLIDLYLSDNEVMMNLRTGFNLDQLDKHAEEAAKKIGL